MSNTLANLTDRATLRPPLGIDLRLLAVGTLVLAVAVAEMAVILLGAPSFDEITAIYAVP